MKLNIPSGAQNVISALQKQGFEAFVVGGCVRDSLLGKEPHDWDICTNASPAQVEACLKDCRIIETGIRHGTVTILADGGAYEVTTYRIDGAYSDHRRPDRVAFVSELREDLARRDFTVNAMAYNDADGLQDPFGGQEDLRRGVIRCVGNAVDRFEEDALRVLRAMRFASTYGFSIAEDTAAAIHQKADRLRYVAQERIFSELCKMLCGVGILDVLLSYSDVIARILPEMKPCIGFEQNNPYHCYDVYEHTAHAVAAYRGEDVTVKLALLFHDVGKPGCYVETETGGHFYGHAVLGEEIARGALERLKPDSKTKTEVLELILYHDAEIHPTGKSIRKWLNKIGEEQLRRLIEVRRADIAAHAERKRREHRGECDALAHKLEEVLAEEPCFSLRDLAVTGYDMMDLGIPEGESIGDLLQWLLEEVMAEALPNEREALIARAEERIRSGSLEELKRET